MKITIQSIALVVLCITHLPLAVSIRNPSIRNLGNAEHGKSRMGGYQEITNLSDNEYLQNAASFAIQQYLAGVSPTYSFLVADEDMDTVKYDVIAARQQVVAGMNYDMLLSLTVNGQCVGGFSVLVYDHFGDLEITDWGGEMPCDQLQQLTAATENENKNGVEGGGDGEEYYYYYYNQDEKNPLAGGEKYYDGEESYYGYEGNDGDDSADADDEYYNIRPEGEKGPGEEYVGSEDIVYYDNPKEYSVEKMEGVGMVASGAVAWSVCATDEESARAVCHWYTQPESCESDASCKRGESCFDVCRSEPSRPYKANFCFIQDGEEFRCTNTPCERDEDCQEGHWGCSSGKTCSDMGACCTMVE